MSQHNPRYPAPKTVRADEFRAIFAYQNGLTACLTGMMPNNEFYGMCQ